MVRLGVTAVATGNAGHVVSHARHPRMPMSERAKIFVPFDPLAGFDEALRAKEREVEAEALGGGGRRRRGGRRRGGRRRGGGLDGRGGAKPGGYGQAKPPGSAGENE